MTETKIPETKIPETKIPETKLPETKLPEIVVTDAWGATAGQWLLEAIEAVVVARDRCRLALSGGTAPIPVMQWLSDHLPTGLLSRLVITWIDERHLPLAPPGSDWRALPDESNLRLAWEHLLSRISVVPALVPMARPEPLPEAAERFAEEFTAIVGRLDVALLGVGPDGHIASLFPGHPQLEATGVCVPVSDSPKPPPQRLTLTLPVLEDLDYAMLVATGSEKASVLRRAYEGDASIPLGRYRPRGAWRWVLDPDAAAELPKSSYEPDSSEEST